MVDAREVITAAIPCNIVYGRPQAADEIIRALAASGFRILGPDEVDPVTLENAAALCLSASVEATNPSRACQANELGEAIRALGRKA